MERVIRVLRTEARLCGDLRGADALSYCLEIIGAQREAERVQRSRDAESVPSQSSAQGRGKRRWHR